MQGPEYLFAFKKNKTEFYGLDDNQQLTEGLNPYFFKYAPSGWDGIQITNTKNKRYWAVDRTTTVPLTYVEDSALILKQILYRYGTEVNIQLLILKQELKFNGAPLGTISFTTGQSPLSDNASATGFITGTVGTTVYVKVSLTNAQSGDFIQGNVGPGNFTNLNTSGVTERIYSFPITSTSGIPFNIFFKNLSGGAVGTISLCNANGSTTSSYGFWYRQSFCGDIDLTDFVHSGAKVTARTLEEGIAKYLKANENYNYELPMNVPEVQYVKMDGITLHNIAETLVSDGNYTTDSNYYRGNHIINTEKTRSDTPFLAGTKSTNRTKVTNLNSHIRATKEWFLKSTIESDVLVTYDFTVILNYFAPPSPNPAAVFKIAIRRIGEDNISDFQSELLSVNPIGFNGTYRVVGSKIITAREGDELYLYAYCNIEGATGDIQLQVNYDVNAANSFFNYDYKYKHPTTYIPFFRPQYVFSQLVSRMTDIAYQAVISQFLLDNKNIVFTCGNGIRNLKDATTGKSSAIMQISFSTFFNFLDCLYSAAISYARNKIDITTKEATVLNSSVIQLASPAYPPKIRIATEFLFNEIEYGWPEIKDEVGVLNGNDEFNCKWSRTLGATKKPSKVSKVSTINTSCYKIEGLRIATFEKDTTNNKNDNELFAIVINDTLVTGTDGNPDHYTLDRTLNPTATGLLEPDTVFNLKLSPQRMLRNNLQFLNSCMLKASAMTLGNPTCDKNSKLVCDGITEKEDVQLGSMGDGFFIPIILDVEVPAPDNILEELDRDPLQLFEVEIDGFTYQGIQLETSINQVTRSTQNYSLLLTKNNDITKLIPYFG